jgi:hypothetical protein
VSLNLNILNHDNKPNFAICNRKEVTDLTLGTNKTGNLVSKWHISDELSLLDHRYICFQIGNIKINQVTFRDPRRTNWESYKDNLKVNMETISRRICMKRDTDQSVDQLQQAIILSHYHNCPTKTTRSPRTALWWNKKLSGLTAKTRNLFNTGKRTGQWDTYKETLTFYNKEIRKAIQSSWWRYCQTHDDHGKIDDQQGQHY